MKAELYTTGFGTGDFDTILRRQCSRADVAHLHAAVAYVSYPGIKSLKRACDDGALKSVSLLTDIRDFVTHPRALMEAKNWGWRLRVSRRPSTFHSKVLLFSSAQSLNVKSAAKTLLVGSNNLSNAGFSKNHETGVMLDGLNDLNVGKFFSDIWDFGEKITRSELAEYEKRFRRVNKARSKATLEALGFDTEAVKNPQDAAISRELAEGVWCGLETFTGGYRLQPEFPRKVADIVRAILPKGSGQNIDVLCDDGEIRQMTFTFYQNFMWRLNVPNDVPGVDRVRAAHQGIALVEKTAGSDTLRFSLVLDPKEIERIKGLSAAIGQIGKTPTRYYGWY